MNTDRIELIVYIIACLAIVGLEIFSIAFSRAMILSDKLSGATVKMFILEAIPMYIMGTVMLALLTLLYTKLSGKTWWKYFLAITITNTLLYSLMVLASL